MKDCKKVLNVDKNHYMALVFCGLCLTELEQLDQAVTAYGKAVESVPDQVRPQAHFISSYNTTNVM